MFTFLDLKRKKKEIEDPSEHGVTQGTVTPRNMAHNREGK